MAETEHAHHTLPVIDDGYRAWWRACPCCLGDEHPEIKKAIDDAMAVEVAGPDRGHAYPEPQD